jgi:hypothetical protein
VSRAAVLHLAAAFASDPGMGPGEAFHGLGTGPLLAGDFFDLPIVEGALDCGGGPGLGVGDAIEFEGEGHPWLGPPRFFGAAP